SICFLIFSASSLLTPSLTAFGAPSTSALASPRPSPVITRTSLITLIFFPPSPVRMTSNSVFSSAAGAAAAAAAGAPPPAARAPLVERGKRSKRLDPVHVEDRVAHRCADDLELVVSLGDIDGHLGRRDGVSGCRYRGRAYKQVADRLVARVLERNQGKAVLRN